MREEKRKYRKSDRKHSSHRARSTEDPSKCMLLGLRQKQEGENSQRGIHRERSRVGEGRPQGFQVQNQSTLLRNTGRSLGRFSRVFVSKESRLEGRGPGWGCCSYVRSNHVSGYDGYGRLKVKFTESGRNKAYPRWAN